MVDFGELRPGTILVDRAVCSDGMRKMTDKGGARAGGTLQRARRSQGERRYIMPFRDEVAHGRRAMKAG